MISFITWIDIIVITVILRAVYIGLAKGFSTEIFKFIGMLLALVLAQQFVEPLSRRILALIPISELLVKTIVFTLLVIVGVLAFALFRTLYHVIDKHENIEMISRISGGAIGLLRGGLIAAFLVHILHGIPVEYIQQCVENKSLTGPFLAKVVPTLQDIIPWGSSDDAAETING